MLFNSLQFLLFFPIVTAVYWFLPHKYRWFHLLLASCVFYAAFVPVYILILFFTIFIDYFAGLYIEQAADLRQRKDYLIISLVANLGILAVFKYYNFFLENTIGLAKTLGVGTYHIPYLSILLPIGLSFHTFQAMSYTIEVYRGNQKAEQHFGIYALYVMFYPQLVAGPIERPQNVIYQFKEKHQFNLSTFIDGLRLMVWGFFKKVVVADRLALYVSAVYASPNDFHYLNLIIATVFFSIQIYCDFSGYSDIALGAAKTMGIDLMLNFNRPYFAKNIQEFWGKWHISLSTWFRDYLYIPLGGNRVSKLKTYLNVTMIFLLSGLWHGANWTFIVWGALHTLYIVGFMFIAGFTKNNYTNKVTKCIGWAITMIFVALAWVYFRADSVYQANTIIWQMMSRNHDVPFSLVIVDKLKGLELGFFYLLIATIFTGIMFMIEYRLDAKLEQLNAYYKLDILFFVLAITSIIGFGIFYNTSFIYFQF